MNHPIITNLLLLEKKMEGGIKKKRHCKNGGFKKIEKKIRKGLP